MEKLMDVLIVLLIVLSKLQNHVVKKRKNVVKKTDLFPYCSIFSASVIGLAQGTEIDSTFELLVKPWGENLIVDSVLAVESWRPYLFDPPAIFSPIYMFSETQIPSLHPELISYITPLTSHHHFVEISEFLSTNPVLANALATMPEVADSSSASTVSNELFLFIEWLHSNEEIVMQFQANIISMLEEAKVQKLINDLFRLKQLRQGLIRLGSAWPEVLLTFMNLYRDCPVVIDCLNEFQAVTSHYPGYILTALEDSTSILQDYADMSLDYQTFKVLLLERLILQKYHAIIDNQSAQTLYPTLMSLLENTSLPGISFTQNAPAHQNIHLLVINLLQNHQYLIPLIHPTDSPVPPLDASGLLLTLEFAIQQGCDVTPLLTQLWTHPELIEPALQLSANEKAFEQMLLNSFSYESLRQTIFAQIEMQVIISSQEIAAAITKHLKSLPNPGSEPAHFSHTPLFSGPPSATGPDRGLLPFKGLCDQEQAQQQLIIFQPEGFMALLQILKKSNSGAYHHIMTQHNLRAILLNLYLNQGDVPWFDLKALEIAAALIEADSELLHGENLKKFLLRFYEQLRVNIIYPFHSVDLHSRSYPNLILIMEYALKKILRLSHEADTNASARTLLILLGQYPNAVCQLLHQGIHISCPPLAVGFLSALEQHANTCSQQVEHCLQVILAHPGLLVPICAVPEINKAQIASVLALTDTIDHHWLMQMPSWQLQILSCALAVVLQKTDGTQTGIYIPDALLRVLSDIISRILPAAQPYIPQLGLLLTRLFPDIEWDMLSTEAEVEKKLVEALAGINLKPENLRIPDSE